jgi:hypothetical protein
MASYFYAIAGKCLDETVPPNLGRSPACQVAFRIHNHSNPQVGEKWEELVRRLAAVNLGLIRQNYRDLTDLIGSAVQAGSETLARMERTRAFLASLISQAEESTLPARTSAWA